jgi:hypothetical protein
MHKPKHRVERSGIFFVLNGHHLLHHRYIYKNFNVVLPLADLCLNTLLVRSKVCFAQARGEGVPDVQPSRSDGPDRRFECHNHCTFLSCLLWVISGNGVTPAPCPFFPSKQTFVGAGGMSEKCQKQT